MLMSQTEPHLINEVENGETFTEPLEEEVREHLRIVGSHVQAFHKDLLWNLSGAFRQANPQAEHLQRVRDVASIPQVGRPKRGKPGTLLAKNSTSVSAEQ